MRPIEITRFERLKVFLRMLRHRIRFSIGKRLPPRETIISERHGRVDVEVCPRCGDLIYCSTQCVMCGQRFKGDPKTVGEVLDRAAES